MSMDHERAETIYTARMLLQNGKRSARSLGVRELIQFLTVPSHTLSDAQTAALFSDTRLRETYAMLKSQHALHHFPAVAAASGGDITERRFEGGTLRLTPSRSGNQVYLLICFTRQGNEAGQPPVAGQLIVETPQGSIEKLALPAPDAAGEVFLVLDETIASDARFMAALRDPLAKGDFLADDTRV